MEKSNDRFPPKKICPEGAVLLDVILKGLNLQHEEPSQALVTLMNEARAAEREEFMQRISDKH